MNIRNLGNGVISYIIRICGCLFVCIYTYTREREVCVCVCVCRWSDQHIYILEHQRDPRKL